MKLVLLLSGGIDSPVAAGLALEQGAELVAVHMLNYPFANVDSTEKIKKMAEVLSKRFNRKIKLIIVPYSRVQIEIAKKTKRKFACVFCRRMMLRIAESIAKEENADALLTGESLGQVASQTLQNLKTESNAVKIPVLKPLLGMDKIEIERIAKKYGTYDVSILPGGCCNLVPEKPSTQAKLYLIEEEEKNLELGKLVELMVAEKKVYSIGAEPFDLRELGRAQWRPFEALLQNGKVKSPGKNQLK